MFSPWQAAEHSYNVEAIPEYTYGATTTAANEAFYLIKQSPQLSMIAHSKVIRTVLQAQERTSERIVRAEGDAQRHDVLMASLKRAGLAAVINASAPRPRAKQPDTPSTDDSKKGPGMGRPPSEATRVRQRWRRSTQAEEREVSPTLSILRPDLRTVGRSRETVDARRQSEDQPVPPQSGPW